MKRQEKIIWSVFGAALFGALFFVIYTSFFRSPSYETDSAAYDESDAGDYGDEDFAVPAETGTVTATPPAPVAQPPAAAPAPKK